jgi:PKD repeat protein
MKTKLFIVIFALLGIVSNAFGQCAGWLPAPTSQVYIISSNPAKITCYAIPNGGSSPFTYLWTFGDGGTSTAASPTHTYTTMGAYTVNLQITDGNGCSMNVPSAIDFAQPCQAHFTVNNSGSNNVHFDGSTTSGYWGHNSWDFGDGTTETNSTASPDHFYTAPGLYTVCENISWPSNGCNSTFCDTVRVSNFSCGMSGLGFVDTLFANNEVHFGIGDGTVVLPPPGVSYSNPQFLFDYGDNSPLDTVLQHTYAQAGTYTVCARIRGQFNTPTNSYPCFDRACTTISINNCSFLPFRDSVIAPQTVLFNNDNGGVGAGCGGTLVYWDFGDGTHLDTIGFATQIAHHFPHDGTFNVCLRMTNANNCQGIVCQSVVVQGGVCALNASIVVAPQVHAQSNLMAETVGGTGDYRYLWNYDNYTEQSIIAPIGARYCVTVTDFITGCTTNICDSLPLCRTLFSREFLTFNTVRFSNLSGNFSDYSWDFGDGTSSTAETPTHLFTSTGTFHVCLNASNLPLNPCDPVVQYPMPCPPQCSIGQYCEDILISQVDTACLHSECVFPGDVNRDQIVNNYDLLPLGVGYGTFGSSRAPIDRNNSFYGHAASAWPQTIASGAINYKHLDCDGDGYIYIGDSYTISSNYGRTHNGTLPTNRTLNTAGIPISLHFTVDTTVVNTTGYTSISADILLGTATQPAIGVYGVAFSINYPAGMVETFGSTGANSVYYDYSSFFGTNAQTINLVHDDIVNGKMDVAIVRTTRTNVSGSGRIASASWVITDNINGRGINRIIENFATSITGVRIIDRLNVEKLGEGSTASTAIVFNHLTATSDENSWQNQIGVSPNPAHDHLIITLNDIRATGFSLQNALGQTIITEIINEQTSTQVDIASLPAGIYTLTINTEKGNVTKKVSKL